MSSKENNIKKILDILQSKEILVIFILIVSILLGYIYSYNFVIPKYETSSTLLLIPNNESDTVTSSDLNLNSELISTYSNIAKQSKILKQVIQNLNLNMTEGELLANLKISNITGTYIIEIMAESTEPEEAMNIANELSQVFLNEIKEIYNLENIGVVDKAEIPTHPYNINHIKDIVVFLGIGVFVVCLLVILRYLFDNTIKTEEDIENYLEIKTLGKIPLNIEKNKELIDRGNAKSYALECINTIRTNILYMTAIKTARTILITSSRAQEGKSFISSNLGAAFADIDKKVLLIDADMRKGRTDKIFDVNNLYGLSDYLCAMTGNIKEDLELGKKYVIESAVPNLHILTNGSTPPNPAELLTSGNMKKLINMMKKVYDIIIIDAPPCMPVSDSIVISTIADATILTVNSEKTKIKELVEVKKGIEIVGGNIIGAILNKVRLEEKTYSKGYYYYGNSEEEENKKTLRKIISAGKIFEQAINELDENDYMLFETEEKLEEKAEIERENITDKILTKEEIQKIIKEEIAKINYTEEFNKINEVQSNYEKEVENLKNIQNINLNQIVSAVSEVRENLKGVAKDLNEKVENNEILARETIEKEVAKINYDNQFERLSDEQNNNLKEIINSVEQMQKGVQNTAENLNEKIENNEAVVREFIEKELEKTIENLNKKIENNEKVINEILEKETAHKKEIQDTIKKEALTKEQVESIVREQVLTEEQIENIVKEQVLTEEQMQNAVRKQVLTREETQNIVKNEISKINYVEEFDKLNETLQSLQNSYLELLNKAKEKERKIEKQEVVKNKKIIDINFLKREKQKKKKVYSINEDIYSVDLEETAFCVIPFERKEAVNRFAKENY